MTTRLQVRRDTAANWTSNNPTLTAGEFGYETDTGAVKIGDGTTAWTSLGYVGDDFHYQYTSTGSNLGSAIADYFPANSSPVLKASSTYEITARAYFLKNTTGNVTWTWLASSAPSMMSSELCYTAVAGFTTTILTTAPTLLSASIQSNTTMAHTAISSVVGTGYSVHTFRLIVRTNAATNLRLRVTSSAGTVTPQAGSYLTAKQIYNHGPTAA